MTDGVLRDLRRLQQYATGLRGLLTDADAHAPEQAAGTDRTGAVAVVLGPDGLPNSVRVAPDWPQRVRPEDVGAAVVEAGQAAAGQRLAAWTQALDDAGWRSRADQLRQGDSPSSDTAAVIAPDPSPRPLQDLVEDMLASFDTIDLVAAAPAQGSGTSENRLVTVTLSRAGILSCSVDPRWTAQQRAAPLARSINSALTAARGDLARQPAAPRPSTRLDGLFAEALGLLADPRRLADS